MEVNTAVMIQVWRLQGRCNVYMHTRALLWWARCRESLYEYSEYETVSTLAGALAGGLTK